MNGNDFLQDSVDPELGSKYVNFLKDKIDMFEISYGFSANAIMRPDTLKRKLAQHTYEIYRRLHIVICTDNKAKKS